MNDPPAAALTREAGYIGSADARLFSWLHCRADRRHRGVAVVICPPLGVDYMNSHRALRHVADQYARAGIPALRFDYLGTGDSADLDPGADLWRNCLESITVAVDALRQDTGCRAVGLFGFRIGAALAGCHARDHPSAFLALWAPVTRGRRYLREIRLLQGLNLEQTAGARLEAAGLVINEATERSLGAMDLLAAPPASDRVLVIPADEVDNEDALCEAWRDGCDEVRQLALEGSAGMLVDAHFSRVPHAAIARLVRETLRPAWSLEPQAAMPPRASEIDIGGDHPVRESLWQDSASSLFLVASVPPEPRPALPLIVFLNSGANHHAGPNRIYVTLCRRLGGLGFPCLRVDLPGLGDAFVDDPAVENVTYLPQLSRHIDRVLDNALRREPGRRVIVAGLCSGAYGAFVSAIELSGRHIVEAILINPLTFFWEEGMSLELAPSRDYQDWNWYMQSLRRGDKWQKLLRGDVNFGKLAATLVKGAKLKAGGQLSRWIPLRPSTGDGVITGHLPTDLARARANRVRLTLFLADSDPGLKIILTSAGDSFKQMIKHDELSAFLIENADHTFSMRDSRERFMTLVIEHLSEAYLDPEQAGHEDG